MTKQTDLQARELDLRRRASTGDPKAKAELAAKEARIDVDNATRALFERARDGDQAALASMRAIAGGKAPGRASATVPTVSRLDVTLAEQSAVKRERSRMAEVFASPHSRLRERGCVTLLTAAAEWSATEIVKELPHLPKDGETTTTASRAKAAAAWDKANAAIGRTKAPAEAKGSSTTPKAAARSGDPWERAYASTGRGK